MKMLFYKIEFVAKKILKFLIYILIFFIIYQYVITPVTEKLNNEKEKYIRFKLITDKKLLGLKARQNLMRNNTKYSVIVELNGQKKKNISKENPHDYKIILEPNYKICNEKTFLVAMVTIATGLFEKRSMIRNTWSNQSHYSNMSIVFLLGRSLDEVTNKKIKKESSIYQDIIQEDFVDTYYNLTTKVIMGFKWICQHCKFAKFVLKIDDDVVVNTKMLMRFLSTHSFRTKSIFGNHFEKPLVVRNKTSKFYVPFKVYPNKYFPPYFGGSAYVITNDLICLLYERSLKLFFPPFSQAYEDIYIGIILSKFNLQFKTFNIQKSFSADFRFYDIPMEVIAKRNKESLLFIYTQNSSDFKRAWDIVRN